MKQVFDELLRFLHQGIAAIFRFVELIWTWSVDQISGLAAEPWQQWPLWKEFLLLLILVGVVWALYQVGRELFEAGAEILSAFAHLLGVVVRTLPHVSRLVVCGSSITSTIRPCGSRPGCRPSKPARRKKAPLQVQVQA